MIPANRILRRPRLRRPADQRSSKTHDGGESAPLSLKELERREIERVLATAPTLRAAATQLGIDPATLWRKRRRLGLD